MVPRSLSIALTLLAAGCAAPAARAPAAAEAPRPLWDLTPEGASAGVVLHDGALARGLDLYDALRVRRSSAEPSKAAKAPMATKAAVASFGLDASQGMAIFAWPERERGLFVILPVRDRAGLLKLTATRAARRGGRLVDELPNGYVCAPAGGRVACAKSLEDIDGAAAPHESGMVRAVGRLAPEDRGDIEIFVSPRTKEIAHLRERARPLGLISGVAAAIRLRDDGAHARVHVVGSMETAGAKGLAGAPPPPELRPIAAGATTVVRAHFDPAVLVPRSATIDPRTRSELLEQLAGDVEVATSGGGVASASLVAPLRDAARVERFVKERCAETGGSERSYGLGGITVTDHGCSMRFDPMLMLLPVAMKAVPISVSVEGSRLVAIAGDAREPRAEDRAWEALVEGEEARRALAGPAALQVMTRRPTFGPDVGASKAFADMVPFFNEKATKFVDIWSDVSAHVYQAVLTARVAEDGVIFDGDFLTFAGDPGEARAAYEEALVKRADGDAEGYRAALADVEARFPGTRAARRAAEVRREAPYFGAGSLFLATLGWLIRGR